MASSTEERTPNWKSPQHPISLKHFLKQCAQAACAVDIFASYALLPNAVTLHQLRNHALERAPKKAARASGGLQSSCIPARSNIVERFDHGHVELEAHVAMARLDTRP